MLIDNNRFRFLQLFDFFTKLSQVSVIFTYYCLILLYLYDFELKQRKQILKISFQFLMGFHSKIYEILERVFCIFPITLGRSTLNNDSTIKTSQIEAFRNTLFSSKKFWRVPEKIGKNKGGQIFFNWFPC